MFSKGDRVVYENNGVCTVDDIGKLDINPSNKDRIYYTLIPVYGKGERIYVPADKDKLHLRPTIDRSLATALIDDICEIEPLEVAFERKREDAYKSCIKLCDCRELLRLIITISKRMHGRISEGKKLTSEDQRYLHMAEENLYGELAVALDVTKEAVAEKVRAQLKELLAA